MLRYLKTTVKIKLKFSRGDNTLMESYVDADWAGEMKDRKSTSGCFILLGNNPIYWHSRKQTCVASSTTEAEFISAAVATKELLWLVQLLENCGVKIKKPIKLYEDNQSCIKLIGSDKYSARTKHIDVKFNVIKDLKAKGICDIIYCETERMIADMFTKPLPKPRFDYLKKTLMKLI